MQVLFEESFEKDIRKLKDKRIRSKLKQIIEEIKAAENKTQIQNLTKLKGEKTYYRIRVGEYRIGVEIIEEKFIFVRLLHRKDIYRYFP